MAWPWILMNGLLFRKTSQLSQPRKILLNLCVSLIGLLIMVLLAVTPNDGSGRCTAAAMILHYFLLSSFLWMLLEGINMYIRLVKLRQQDAIQSFWKVNLAVWGKWSLHASVMLILCWKLTIAYLWRSFSGRLRHVEWFLPLEMYRLRPAARFCNAKWRLFDRGPQQKA